MTNDKRLILLGQIAGAHGIRGEVSIKSYTADPEDIAAYGELTDETQLRRYKIVSARATQKGVIARIEGVADRNAAEALAGAALYVARDKLPAATEGEYYHTDLVGLAVEDETGSRIGRVVGVHNFGAGDLVEIAFEAQGGRTELLPFTDAFVPVVDVPGGRMVIRPDTADDDETGPRQEPR